MISDQYNGNIVKYSNSDQYDGNIVKYSDW